MLKKVLLYPFDNMSESILKHEKSLKNMKIEKIVSPIGWGYRQDYKSYEVTHDFKNALKECDVVWIVNSKRKLAIEMLKEKIEDAVYENKEVIITRELDEKEKLGLQTLITCEKCKIITGDMKVEHCLKGEALCGFDCPIVYIVGATEFTKRFEILLSLEEEFRKKGYKVLSFSSRKEGEMLGINYLPEIYMLKSVSEVEKIKIVNSLVKSKEVKYNPDIIFVQVPGRILGTNNSYIEDSVVGMYELSYAIPPDCIILSMMYTENFDNIIYHLQEQCGRLFGIHTDYINIVERLLDEPDDENEINYLMLNSGFLKNKIFDFSKEKDKLIYLHDEKSYEDVVSKMINLLGDYGSIETI